MFDHGTCSPAREDQIKTRDAMALTTDILLGTGGAVAATGIVLLILSGRQSDGESDLSFAPMPRGFAASVRF